MQQIQEMHLLFGAESNKICTEFHSSKKSWSPVQMIFFFVKACTIPVHSIFNEHCLHLIALAKCTSLCSRKLETSYDIHFTQEELNHKESVSWLRSHRKKKKEIKIQPNFPKNPLGCLMRHSSSTVSDSSICRFGMYLWLWIASLLICKSKYNLEKYFCWYEELTIYVKMTASLIQTTCLLLLLQGTTK